MTPAENYAKHVQERRITIGYRTAQAFAEQIGISARLVGEIENARRDSYSPDTLARVDETIGWAPSTSQKLLKGETNTPQLNQSIYDQDICGNTRGRGIHTTITDEIITALQELQYSQKTLPQLLNTRAQAFITASLFGANLDQLNTLTWLEYEKLLAPIRQHFNAILFKIAYENSTQELQEKEETQHQNTTPKPPAYVFEEPPTPPSEDDIRYKIAASYRPETEQEQEHWADSI